MGKANERELAVLLVDRLDTHSRESSPPLFIADGEKMERLVRLTSSSSLLKVVFIGWLLSIASVFKDAIKFLDAASLIGAYKSSKTLKSYRVFEKIFQISV